MSTRLDIPAHEAHVVRVFAVIEEAGAPLPDADVMAALGADHALDSVQIELFDLRDLGAMTLSDYLADAHGLAEAELAAMRRPLDALTGRVLIVPSRAFAGQAMVLRIGAALRLVGRFDEEAPPVRFEPLPEGGARGAVAPSGASAAPRRPARLAALGFFAGLALLAVIVIWLAALR